METHAGEMSNSAKRFHKPRMKSPAEEQTSSSSSPLHSRKPNGSSRSDWSSFGLRSKCSFKNGGEQTAVDRNGGEKVSSRGERPLFSPGAKAATNRSRGLAQARVNGREWTDAQNKGDQDPRLNRGSARRAKPEDANMSHFEVMVADFPELGVEGKGSWAQNASPMRVAAPRSAWKNHKEDPPPADPGTSVAGKNSSDVTPGHQPVTSWAVVASQPPKKPPPKETTIKNNQQLQEESVGPQEEGLTNKKKRKKKKKKPKDTSEDAGAEEEESLTHQEPPKFEDEDEFPDLNSAGLCEVQRSSSVSKPSNLKSEKTSGKKSKAPVQLDIGNMLAALEETHKSHKAKQDVKSVISVGGGLPFIAKQPPVQKKLPWQQEKVAHNPLDSTSPLVKKGKQREVPKAKKPTPLKKIILKEREERKQRRLLEERGLCPEPESAQEADAVEEQDEESSKAVQDGGETCASDDVEPQKEGGVEPRSVPDSSLKPRIHSRKFRDYCSQMLSKEVDECVMTLLKELVRFQDRLHQKDPMKARMKRRVVMGLREVLKHLKLRKVKCVIISPNCERVQSKGGLDEALHTIIDTCREQEVPFIFALSRKALGRCLSKVVPVSLVGIFNYDGAQDHYHRMIELSAEARKAYEVMVSSLEQEEQEDVEGSGTSVVELKISEQSSPEGSAPSPAALEEPEYIKMWKSLLKDCSHEVLDFQSRLMEPHVDDDEPS